MTDKLQVLDLFSAAAGGWSLGMHRAGFQTMAACENVAWRRALYQENNAGVRIYDDVRTLTADQLLRDIGYLPDIIVGSPPCQDISSANTKGKGVEGERSGLYFEAVRIIGECRPRWFALENSSNLRTRGADAVLAALETLGYACWSFVVRAGDIGANHERPRCWIIGCDVEQVTDASQTQRWAVADSGSDRDRQEGERSEGPDRHSEYAQACRGDASRADGVGRDEEWSRRRRGVDVSFSNDIGHSDGERGSPRLDAPSNEGGDALGPRRLRPDPHDQRGDLLPSEGNAPDASEERWKDGTLVGRLCASSIAEAGRIVGRGIEARDVADPDQAGQADGCVVPSLRQAEIADDGCGLGRSDDGSIPRQVGLCSADRSDIAGWRPDWTLDDLAGHLRLDDGLSSWLAGTRVALGTPKGTSAASLIVEAFGDAVLPQIPEAIGRAMIRTEIALGAIYGRKAA